MDRCQADRRRPLNEPLYIAPFRSHDRLKFNRPLILGKDNVACRRPRVGQTLPRAGLGGACLVQEAPSAIVAESGDAMRYRLGLVSRYYFPVAREPHLRCNTPSPPLVKSLNQPDERRRVDPDCPDPRAFEVGD